MEVFPMEATRLIGLQYHYLGFDGTSRQFVDENPKYDFFNLSQIVSIQKFDETYFLIRFSNNRYIYISNEIHQRLIENQFLTVEKL